MSYLGFKNPCLCPVLRKNWQKSARSQLFCLWTDLAIFHRVKERQAFLNVVKVSDRWNCRKLSYQDWKKALVLSVFAKNRNKSASWILGRGPCKLVECFGRQTRQKCLKVVKVSANYLNRHAGYWLGKRGTGFWTTTSRSISAWKIEKNWQGNNFFFSMDRLWCYSEGLFDDECF